MIIAKALNVNVFKLLRTMVITSKPAKNTPALRPSASLVVVNSSNEVLLVHRNPIMTSFAGMHVRHLLSNFSPSTRLIAALSGLATLSLPPRLGD
jgi:hypothetical protein